VVQIAEETGSIEGRFWGHWQRLGAFLDTGDIERVDVELTAMRSAAEEFRQPFYLYFIPLLDAMRALSDGRWSDVEVLIPQALAAGQGPHGLAALGMFGAQLFPLRREQRRIAEMEAPTRGYVDQFPLLPAWRTALAYLYCELGRFDEARAQYERCGKPESLPRDWNWPIAMALLAEVCWHLDDLEAAPKLYDLLVPFANRNVIIGPMAHFYGSTSRFLGLLATTLQRWDDAEKHFNEAIEMHVKLSPPWLGWTQFQYADMLLRRGSPGDREKALSLLSQALDIAQRLEMKALLERALALKLEVQGVSFSDVGTSIETVAREALAEQPDLRSHAAPDGTVTIMFSDIEGSTALAERLGDKRFMEFLREHNAIVRAQVKAHGGFEVKSEGDGFMVAFQSAGKALACASAIQKALVERNESAEEPVRVRMGLHAGEVIKEGEDFFGRNVIMAARVASQANGGEILTSGVLKSLLQGSDVSWGEKRTVTLKGLSGEHEVWSVAWELG
jgi:eukaryotic-like serine/threonine-protein kinase